MHGMQDNSKESDDSSKCDKISFFIKFKGGDCWHYEISVVLDGKPHKMTNYSATDQQQRIYDQTKKNEES